MSNNLPQTVNDTTISSNYGAGIFSYPLGRIFFKNSSIDNCNCSIIDGEDMNWFRIDSAGYIWATQESLDPVTNHIPSQFSRGILVSHNQGLTYVTINLKVISGQPCKQRSGASSCQDSVWSYDPTYFDESNQIWSYDYDISFKETSIIYKQNISGKSNGLWTDCYCNQSNDAVSGSYKIYDVKITKKDCNGSQIQTWEFFQTSYFSIPQGTFYGGRPELVLRNDSLFMAYGTVFYSNRAEVLLEHEDFPQNYVSICQGDAYKNYSTSGTYFDTLTNSMGCDSFQILNLNVWPNSGPEIIDSICFGESLFGYNQSGIYIDTLASSKGCDSLRQINLTVLPQYFTEISESICFGESFFGYHNSGAYIDTLESLTGCDSIREINLTVENPIFTVIDTIISVGENYEGYSISGLYIDTLNSNSSCDSIRTIKLEIETLVNKIEHNKKPVISPNPSNGRFFIDSDDENIENIEVYDLTGKLEYISNEPQKIINLDVTNGIYIIIIKTSTNQYFQKLHIE